MTRAILCVNTLIIPATAVNKNNWATESCMLYQVHQKMDHPRLCPMLKIYNYLTILILNELAGMFILKN
jgi:hypothetical protein